MKNIIEFGNIIKYDIEKCNRCRKCVYGCKTRALSLYNNVIEIDSRRCVACKECLKLCDINALYYNANIGFLEGKNTVAIIPYDADEKFLNKNFDKVITYELGEKVKVIETAFQMEKLTSKKICNEKTESMIVSDIESLDLILKYKYPNMLNYLCKIKSSVYLSSYLERLLNSNKDIKIVAYGVPFENKMFFNNIKIIDEICDIPYSSNFKYNILDILNTYKQLCKFETDVDIKELNLKDKMIIRMYNKNIESKILLINDTENLNSIEITDYDFIFICKNHKYKLNDNLLKDEEVNKLYKTKLKYPCNTSAFYKK